MPTLPKELRNQLARVTLDARGRAESASRAALENLAVHEREPRKHMSVEQRQLRNRLRARGRALGDTLDERSAAQGIDHLAEAAAYEQWHRLLFTRFLVENHLLMMPDDAGGAPVAVTVKECDELAPEMGARDGFDLACRFASRVLPGVFRSDDPALQLRLALNDEVELRKLLDSLPADVFTASDSLGWTYQFWQADEKETVNKSGKKIGADELPSVTQLFTEDYMVDFLLDNTLGAWHAGKFLAANPMLAANSQSEADLRQAVALPGCPWSYLRFLKCEDGRWQPAAGRFDGWPKTAAALRALDPCMGSGHFVVAMFERLVALRLAEEKSDETAAVAAVIRENLFGLEIDPRCTQIGAFNLALAAWRRVGHCQLPAMNLACSGLAPNTKREDWLKLTVGAPHLRFQMGALYDLFEKAPVLGSLINPRADKAVTYGEALHELQPLLEKALAQETKDDTAHEMAVTARGLAKAAEILGGQFTLVATNVPYLKSGNQDQVLKDFLSSQHGDAKADLATAFVERCLGFCQNQSTTALVTPQNWLFSGAYEAFRFRLLGSTGWLLQARLGSGAFETIGGEVVNVVLLVNSSTPPSNDHRLLGIDVAGSGSPSEKAEQLVSCEIATTSQRMQRNNPDSRILLEEQSSLPLLRKYASAYWGLGSGDYPRFGRYFWEIDPRNEDWIFQSSTVDKTNLHSGREHCLYWEKGTGALANHPGAFVRGVDIWDKTGVLVSQTGELRVTLFDGGCWDSNSSPIVPHNVSNLSAIWCFCSSPKFRDEVRKIDQKLKVTNDTLVKVPFDLAHWKKVAAEKYPHGLPKPFSSDPTQWLFNGHPKGADQPLHVAVARLLGYQWPRQTGSNFPDCPALKSDGLEKLADKDGIVCLQAINREPPAADRLRALLTVALGKFDERALIASAGIKGSKSTTLEDWLRDECFEQHCDLFHQRPFLWHIWDGRKDGFHVFCNYHQLDNATLQKLTYSTLGDWIRHQVEDDKSGKPGAAARLGAARALQAELAKILEGEAPYDIFVRWKPLAKQAIGWRPDLNDGVRLNIRPLLTAPDVGKKGAGLLRTKPNIKWDKDRGTEPQRDKAKYAWFWCEDEPGTDPKAGKEFAGNRWNDVHLTLAAKRAAK